MLFHAISVYFLTFLSLMPLSNPTAANYDSTFKSDAVFEYLDVALKSLTNDDKSKLLSKVCMIMRVLCELAGSRSLSACRFRACSNLPSKTSKGKCRYTCLI